jgi:hypothetical protein
MKKKPKQPAIDKAFLGSDKHTLGDLKLQPWTPERIIKAQEIGMLYPSLGKQDWEQYRKTKVYPGAVKDVMIFLFLSTLKADEIDNATCDQAKSFGIKRGIHQTDSTAFWEAYTKFIEVQNEIQTAATKPKSATGTGTDDEEDDDPNE